MTRSADVASGAPPTAMGEYDSGNIDFLVMYLRMPFQVINQIQAISQTLD